MSRRNGTTRGRGSQGRGSATGSQGRGAFERSLGCERAPDLVTSVARRGGGSGSRGGRGYDGCGREGGRAPRGSNLVKSAAGRGRGDGRAPRGSDTVTSVAGRGGGHISYAVTSVAGRGRGGGGGCDSNLVEAKVSSHQYI